MAAWKTPGSSNTSPKHLSMAWELQNSDEGVSIETGSPALLTREQLAHSQSTSAPSPNTPFSSYGHVESSANKGGVANSSMLSLAGSRSRDFSLTRNPDSMYNSSQHFSRMYSFPEDSTRQDASPSFHGSTSQNASFGVQPSRSLAGMANASSAGKRPIELKDDLQQADVGLRLEESGAGTNPVCNLHGLIRC
jgi:hypothetical protein